MSRKTLRCPSSRSVAAAAEFRNGPPRSTVYCIALLKRVFVCSCGEVVLPLSVFLALVRRYPNVPPSAHCRRAGWCHCDRRRPRLYSETTKTVEVQVQHIYKVVDVPVFYSAKHSIPDSLESPGAILGVALLHHRSSLGESACPSRLP